MFLYRSNVPKEIMGYPDFHFPSQKKSYITAGEVLDYLELYAKTFNLCKFIKFLHQVIRVKPVIGTTKWEVRIPN